MRACSSSRASCHPLMVTDPTLSVVFLATIFLLPSSLYRKGTAQINLSDAVEFVFDILRSPLLKRRFSAGVFVPKPVSKSKYQYLTYSMGFDTLTARPFCPTSPIAPVLRDKGYT